MTRIPVDITRENLLHEMLVTTHETDNGGLLAYSPHTLHNGWRHFRILRGRPVLCAQRLGLHARRRRLADAHRGHRRHDGPLHARRGPTADGPHPDGSRRHGRHGPLPRSHRRLRVETEHDHGEGDTGDTHDHSGEADTGDTHDHSGEADTGGDDSADTDADTGIWTTARWITARWTTDDAYEAHKDSRGGPAAGSAASDPPRRLRSSQRRRWWARLRRRQRRSCRGDRHSRARRGGSSSHRADLADPDAAHRAALGPGLGVDQGLRASRHLAGAEQHPRRGSTPVQSMGALRDVRPAASTLRSVLTLPTICRSRPEMRMNSGTSSE